MQPVILRFSFKKFLPVSWILFFLIFHFGAGAQNKSSIKWGRFDLLRIDSTWQFKSGAALPEYFDKHFDDSKWQTVKRDFFDSLTYKTPGWNKIGVFRRILQIPDSLKGRQVELFFSQAGASEFYLDGKLIARFGIITPVEKDEVNTEQAVNLQLDSQSTHLFAVYYANHIDTSVIDHFEINGYGLEISPVSQDFNDHNDVFHHAIISTCVILSFCFFFCCVFLFYPYRLASLVSAFYLANFSLIFIGGLISFVNHDFDQWRIGNNLWQIGFACNPGWNLLFLYSIYYNKLPKRAWIIIAAMMVCISFVVFSFPLSMRIIVSIIILYQVESWRIIVLGIRKKRTGFRIIAIGNFISIAGSLITIIDLFQFFPWYLTVTQTVLAIVTDISFPLTLALQFALEFGSANRDLRKQLLSVSELSKKNIEQEQEKQQILALQNETLEKQVTERTAQVVTQKEEIEKQRDTVTATLETLRSTQNQLVQSEKMASLGELTAGIAHEIQNPLNFVNNFSEVNIELIGEMKKEMEAGNLDEVRLISSDLEQNTEKIIHHGKRADSIVKGMLQHSRKSTGTKEETDINVLADEYLRLSFHGLRAKDKSFNAKLETDFAEDIGKIHIIPQDIGRVLLNLYNNAFYAIAEKANQQPAGYEPVIRVSTKRVNDKIEIRVKDNGNGIPGKLLEKIFQPFFTTKPTGQGTGLGLSLSYDLVKAQGGEIRVITKEGTGSEFIVEIPVG